MGTLGEYNEEEFRVLQPEPPGGDGDGEGEDEDEKPQNPENLNDDEIDDIIEKAKENGFDGIDDDSVVDEDDDLTPEPDEDEDEEEEKEGDDEEKEGGDEEGGDCEGGNCDTPEGTKEGEEGEEGEGEEGEGEEGEGEEGEGEGEEEEEEEDGDAKDINPEFEDISEESEDDKQRRLRVRYAQLMKKIQNGQKSMSDISSKYGKKIPERIVGQMKQSAGYLQDLKETNVYED